MQQVLVALEGVSVRLGGENILDDITLAFRQGEQWALIGPSGSGKTALAHAIAGQLFYRGKIDYFFPVRGGGPQQVIVAEQQHKFKNRSNTSDFYYQQRFNAADADNSLTVAEELAGYPGNSTGEKDWVHLLHLDALLNEPLLQLSNGENKRLQLVKALLEDPALLVLDNPFTGLDTEGRKTLHAVITTIVSEGRHLLLITPATELPDCITHIAILEKGRLAWAGEKSAAPSQLLKATTRPIPAFDPSILRPFDRLRTGEAQDRLSPGLARLRLTAPAPAFSDFEYAVRLVNTTVRYGDKIILDAVNWEVKKGERWNLSGPNGAGKSTLLSLITADNPQAYANEIYLFDRRRGSGESIWDIKQKTGFVSPELHVYFEQGVNCFEVIACGLFDTIGLFRRLSEEQEESVLLWMRLLQMEATRDKPFHQVSAGQQRMLLLARALIKNPPLLILDEPCQGLDDEQAGFFRQLVNSTCELFSTTLLYVSHYRRDIPECVTKFLRLEGGKRADSLG